MAIMYCTITRSTTVLANHATCTGNFQEITAHILAKIRPGDDKMTYTQTGFLFHYIVESGITYLCITNESFDRSLAFSFLNDIKKRFRKTYQNLVATALPYAMQSEFSRVLATEMNHYSNPANKNTSNMRRVEEEINELQESIQQRGEKLELLVEKTDDLNAASITFKKTSRTLSYTMMMKNIKLGIAIAVIVLVIILIIVFAACGSDWSACGKKAQ